MSLRDNVLIRENAIAPQDLALLRAYVLKAEMQDTAVSNFMDAQDAGKTEWKVRKEIRDTQNVELSDEIKAKLDGIESTTIEAHINPFYKVSVRDKEPTQILHYGVGGHYIPHVDAETPYQDDIGHRIWGKVLDRDLSIVYFINDDFAGGELVFPELDITIRPKAGMLVCFPSDHNYLHGVKPVSSGHRFTIVNWMRVKGMPSMDEINQQAIAEHRRVYPKQMIQPPRVAKDGKVSAPEP